jgi:SnoaL-like domain
MSEEHLEILRLLNEAFNSRDIDAGLRFIDPEVELYPGIDVPDEGPLYLGRQGLKNWFWHATEPWETITVEPKERIELEGDRVLAIDRWLFRGRQGIEIEMELPTLYTFRNALVVRIDGFADRAEAFKAVGLGM